VRPVPQTLDTARYLTRHGSSRIARVALIAPITPFILETADNPVGIDEALFEKKRGQRGSAIPK
jgi:non-heme chloroperoxidase